MKGKKERKEIMNERKERIKLEIMIWDTIVIN